MREFVFIVQSSEVSKFKNSNHCCKHLSQYFHLSSSIKDFAIESSDRLFSLRARP